MFGFIIGLVVGTLFSAQIKKAAVWLWKWVMLKIKPASLAGKEE